MGNWWKRPQSNALRVRSPLELQKIRGGSTRVFPVWMAGNLLNDDHKIREAVALMKSIEGESSMCHVVARWTTWCMEHKVAAEGACETVVGVNG